MDYTLYSLSYAGNSHIDEQFHLHFASNPHFDSGKVNQEGSLLKIERDIFLMSGAFNNKVGNLNTWLDGTKFKEVGNLNFWKFLVKFDGDTQSIWFGGDLDPYYVGKY